MTQKWQNNGPGFCSAFEKSNARPNPGGGIDNLLVRRAIIKVVGYGMITGCIVMFTEQALTSAWPEKENKHCLGSLGTKIMPHKMVIMT